VAVAVVDLLEEIDVDVHAGQAVALAPRARDLLDQAPVHVAAVVDAGQRIGQADVLQHLVADHVFQADRDDRSHVLDEVGAQQRREAARIAAAQVQAADQAFVAHQRHQRDAGQAGRRMREQVALAGAVVGTGADAALASAARRSRVPRRCSWNSRSGKVSKSTPSLCITV
jgi:hypothetical protein